MTYPLGVVPRKWCALRAIFTGPRLRSAAASASMRAVSCRVSSVQHAELVLQPAQVSADRSHLDFSNTRRGGHSRRRRSAVLFPRTSMIRSGWPTLVTRIVSAGSSPGGASSASSRSNRLARVLVIMAELIRLWPSSQRGQPVWLLKQIEGGQL